MDFNRRTAKNKSFTLVKGIGVCIFFILGGLKLYSCAYYKAKDEFRKEKINIKEKAYADGYEDGYVDALVNM